MRLHITLDDHLVARLDQRTGPRGRSRYITESVRQALEQDERWDGVINAIGSLPDHGHEWDADPEGWVAAERRADPNRTG